MALALEKQCGVDGSSLNNRDEIYDWMDKVRRMGLDVKFADR